MAEGELQIVCRLIKADLTKNFEAFGKMDPYATFQMRSPDGAVREVGQTKTDWNAHKSPVWNHTFPGQASAQDCLIIISVYEDDVVGKDDLIGVAQCPVAELLGAASKETGEATGSVRELPLKNDELGGEVTGKVALQIMLVRRTAGNATAGNLTKIDASEFESPVVRLGVSGGTAPFFTLKMLKPPPGESPGFYIGKDLSHATDEVMFYEKLKDILNGPGGALMAPLLSFCFQYRGILNSEVSDAKPGSGSKDLLVMRNMFDGAKKLRLLDIKIGQRTADGGWQGKSKMAAFRQGFVDGLTNSAAEGFRLEGFDGPPPSVSSMDPLLDLHGVMDTTNSAKMKKKALRYMLQTMTGAEMLNFFTDVHQEPADIGEAQIGTMRTPLELSEIVLSEIVKRLVRLAIACRLVIVPQKWIGSSVALGFDAGQTPARTVPEAEIREQVKVHIFDWGRSELNSLENHEALTKKERADRATFWCYYVGGIDRLALEATRMYHNRFSISDEWSEFLCVISDFDSTFKNDCMGMVAIPIKETPETTLTLKDPNGKEVKSMLDNRPAATITYSLTYRSYPSTGANPSRLKGAWRFHVKEANNLPRKDVALLKGTSDPFVDLVATSKDGTKTFRQQTTCKMKCLDPVFNETLLVPVAVKSDHLEAMLKSISPRLTKEIFRYLPPEEIMVNCKKAAVNATKQRPPPTYVSDQQSLDGFQGALDATCENTEALEPFFRGESDNGSSSAAAPSADPIPRVVTSSDHGSSSQMLSDIRAMRGKEKVGTEDSLKIVADMSPSNLDNLKAESGRDPISKGAEMPLFEKAEIEDPAKLFAGVGALVSEDYRIEQAAKPGQGRERDGKDGGQCGDKCSACKCM